MAHRRSFKGHIKRLYEFHHTELFPSGLTVKQMAKHHCQLRESTKRHVNLVSRFCKGPGDFPLGTKGFSKALYDQVQLLTSSDESPSGLPEAVLPVLGDAPQ